LRKSLEQLKNTTICIQLLSRKNDLLSFIKNFAQLGSKKVTVVAELSDLVSKAHSFNGCIPKPLQKMQFDADELIRLRNISVSYLEKPIVHAINWTIKKGEFWQLSGPNGSGKSTLLSMVTGENPKGYGQDLHIFGQKKGSGESVWDIKKRIGYFTPSLTDSFRGYQVVENMLISGLYDSIGLYTKPVESQVRLANEWLALLNLSHLKDQLFHELSEGQKRLIQAFLLH